MQIFQSNLLFKPNHNGLQDLIFLILSAMIFGRKCDASPLFLIMSLTIVEATEVYLGSPVKKKVSIPGSSVLFASAIVFSYSKSLTYLIPRRIYLAPTSLQKFTVRPSYSEASTFGWSL